MAIDDYDLTQEEKDVFNRYHEFYEDLDTGRRKPSTLAQRHFVECCRGRAVAETVHEKAYLKDRLFRLNNQKASQKQNTKGGGIPMYEEGQARPGWCETEDIKKLRGRQLGTIHDIHDS